MEVTLWHAAPMGNNPERADFVRCGRITMTREDYRKGRMTGQIGIAPSWPAKFVVFRVSRSTAKSAFSR